MIESYRFKFLLECKNELEVFKEKYRFLLSAETLKNIEEAIEKIDKQVEEILQRNSYVIT